MRELPAGPSASTHKYRCSTPPPPPRAARPPSHSPRSSPPICRVTLSFPRSPPPSLFFLLLASFPQCIVRSLGPPSSHLPRSWPVNPSRTNVSPLLFPLVAHSPCTLLIAISFLPTLLSGFLRVLDFFVSVSSPFLTLTPFTPLILFPFPLSLARPLFRPAGLLYTPPNQRQRLPSPTESRIPGLPLKEPAWPRGLLPNRAAAAREEAQALRRGAPSPPPDHTHTTQPSRRRRLRQQSWVGGWV